MSTAIGTDIALMPEHAVYMASGGELQLDVRIDGETVWLTQAQIAELFDVDLRTISEHLGNVYAEGDLEQRATLRKFPIVQREGKREVARQRNAYNVDAIISVG